MVAVDATGLAQTAVSSYFIRRVEHFGQKPRTWKHWLKWLAVVDVERKIIVAQSARHAPWNDCATLPTLVGQAHQLAPVGCVLADAEFDSEQPYFLPRATEGRQHHPRQTLHKPQSNRRPPADARELPTSEILPPLLDRECLLGCQAQALLPRCRQNHRHAVPPSSPARPRLQPLSPLAGPPFRRFR